MVENVLLGFSLGKVVSHHDAVQFRLCSLMDVGVSEYQSRGPLHNGRGNLYPAYHKGRHLNGEVEM